MRLNGRLISSKLVFSCCCLVLVIDAGVDCFSLLDRLQRIESIVKNAEPVECLPGSLFYNGSCIFISNQYQKLTWENANRFCKKLPFNASLLTVRNDDQLEKIRLAMLRIKEKENPKDQLLFYIGFKYINETWKWTENHRSLLRSKKTIKNLDDHWHDWNNSLGDCGSLVLLRNKQLILRSAPCSSASNRFMCEYVLNACYGNKACGRNGRCVNMFKSFYCDCSSVSIFYEGKYCQKLNSKAIQTISALVLVLVILMVIVFMKSNRCRLLLTKHLSPKRLALCSIRIIQQKLWLYFNELSRLARLFRIYRLYFFEIGSYYVLHVMLVLFVVFMQILFFNRNLLSRPVSDAFMITDFDRFRRQNELVGSLCVSFNRYYMFQEFIYLLITFGILFIYFLIKRTKIYSNYITRNYKLHLKLLKQTEYVWALEERENEENDYENEDEDKDVDVDVDENETTHRSNHGRSGDGLKSKLFHLFSNSFSSASMPFSTSNRLKSSCIFIIYTYDILNLIMQIFSIDFYKQTTIKFLNKNSGIFVDLLIQFVQIILVAFKYYPLLIVVDENSNVLIYGVCFMYMSFIFTIRFIDQVLCSGRLSSTSPTKFFGIDFSDLLRFNNNQTSSINNTSSGSSFSDLNSHASKVFSEYFDSYREANWVDLDAVQLPPVDLKSATSSVNSEDLKAIGSSKPFDYVYWIDLAECLPVYFAISYLLVHYSLRFISMLIDFLIDLYDRYRNSRLTTEVYLLKKIKSNRILSSSSAASAASAAATAASEATTFKDQESTLIVAGNTNSSSCNYRYINRVVMIVDKEKGESNTGSCLFDYVYKYVPFKKFSKQFIDSYTVAFMIIYLFTVYGVRLSYLIDGYRFNRLIDMVYRFLFDSDSAVAAGSGIFVAQQMASKLHEKINYFLEFRLAILLTSAIVVGQLLLSVASFRNDLHKLNQGQLAFSGQQGKFSKLFKRKRGKLISSIISNSIHFQGYLISHLVYGYLLTLLCAFVAISLVKLLLQMPNNLFKLIQFLMPLLIVIILRLLIVHLINTKILLRNKSRHIRDPSVYYFISYFSFFYDCLLGLIACLNRLWQTTLLTLLSLPRIDKSVFNEDNKFIMSRLDKGHLAYMNYVYIEHIYNNPILIGFSDYLVESMIKCRLELIERSHHFHRMTSSSSSSSSSSRRDRNSKEFKLKSYLTLRNILFMVILTYKTKNYKKTGRKRFSIRV